MARLNGAPFTVTAHTPAGVAFDPRLGVALDGILTSVVRGAAAPEGAAPSTIDGGLSGGAGGVLHVWELPLARCGDSEQGGWHWAATTGWPSGPGGVWAGGPATHHRLFQTLRTPRVEEAATGLPKHLSKTRGRLRDRVTYVPVWPCTALVWRAVGDPGRVRELVEGLPSVGARRGSGEGWVSHWVVEEHPDVADLDLFAHTHPDGWQGRPLPGRCVTRLGLPPGETSEAGLRPPMFHPANRAPLVFPPAR